MAHVRILAKNGKFKAEVRMSDHPLAMWVSASREWCDTEAQARADGAESIERNRRGDVVAEYEVPGGSVSEPHIPQPAPDSRGEITNFGDFAFGLALGAAAASLTFGVLLGSGFFR